MMDGGESISPEGSAYAFEDAAPEEAFFVVWGGKAPVGANAFFKHRFTTRSDRTPPKRKSVQCPCEVHALKGGVAILRRMFVGLALRSVGMWGGRTTWARGKAVQVDISLTPR